MREKPEERGVVGNEAIRLDFDPRTSDTMYNYIWLKRPDTGRWERVHNLGIDVGADRSDTGDLINTIGMDLILSREARSMRVRYPNPLIQYRQFDDKIGTPEKVAKYPDFTTEEMPGLVHAEGSLEFVYQVDAERPSFVVSGRVLEGRVRHVVYIIDALWTDNHSLPTHEYIDGLAEFDIRTPEAIHCRDVEVEGAAGPPSTRCEGGGSDRSWTPAAGASRPREAALPFALFYRHDGDGVPFALLAQSPEKARFCNFYDNWKCHYDFRAASLNQQFIPREPPVTGCNDTGYIASPRSDGSLPGVRVAFFPELGWGRGGRAHVLRDRIVAAIREHYWDAVDSWNRAEKGPRPGLRPFIPPSG